MFPEQEVLYHFFHSPLTTKVKLQREFGGELEVEFFALRNNMISCYNKSCDTDGYC